MSSTAGPQPQAEDLDAQMVSTPDTPPATGTQTAFFQQTAPPQQAQHLEQTLGRYENHGIETPPPSALHFTRVEGGGMLPTPPPANTSAPSSQEERKSLAELYAQAGWGGKKAFEEYETIKERQLDQGFDLSWTGDDFDESDMWRQ